MAGWTASEAYAFGSQVIRQNPPTWWDRVRMFFGFKRKSPATTLYVCEAQHQSSDRWRITTEENNGATWSIELEPEDE